MAYVTVPKDLTKVKSKVMFGLTKRQLVCFGAAALIGGAAFLFAPEDGGVQYCHILHDRGYAAPVPSGNV